MCVAFLCAAKFEIKRKFRLLLPFSTLESFREQTKRNGIEKWDGAIRAIGDELVLN